MPDDPNTPAGGGTPPAPVTPPPAAVTPPASTPETISLTSEQLKKRLDESATAAQRKFLKGLGFEKDEDLQAALKRLKETDEASKTEQERLKGKLDELAPKAERAESLNATLLSMVNDQLSDLPEEARKLIDDEVGDDPEARLVMLRFAKAIGVKPAATAAPGVTPPTTTAPSPAPPPSGAPTKFQEWEAMRARSPGLGDIFYQTHQREIERTRPAN